MAPGTTQSGTTKDTTRFYSLRITGTGIISNLQNDALDEATTECNRNEFRKRSRTKLKRGKMLIHEYFARGNSTSPLEEDGLSLDAHREASTSHGMTSYPLVRAVTQPRLESTTSGGSTPVSSPLHHGYQPRTAEDMDSISRSRSRASSLLSNHSAHSCWSIPSNLNQHHGTARRTRLSSIPPKARASLPMQNDDVSVFTPTPPLKPSPNRSGKNHFDFTSIMSRPYTISYADGNVNQGSTNGGGFNSGVVIHYDRRVAQRKRIVLNRRQSSADQLAEGIIRKHKREKEGRTNDDSAVVKTPSMLRNSKQSPHHSRKYVRRQESTIIEDYSTSNSTNSNLLHNRVDKKQIDKLRANMKDLLELFTAVEQDDLGKVRSMLEKDGVDVNGENLDDLTLLDVATMLNHNAVAQLLLKHGAQENPRLSSQTVRLKKIQTLLDAAHTKLAELRIASKKGSPSKDMERQLCACESRLHILRKMKTNFESAVVPFAPRNVTVQVASKKSLIVSLEAPDQTHTVVTRYRVEWSLGEDFSVADGSLLLKDLRRMEAKIQGLDSGMQYYIRVSSGNFKGYGDPTLSHPICATPSSWRDVEGRADNVALNQLKIISDLYQEVKLLRKSPAWERIYSSCCENVTSTSAFKKRKASLKNLFSASSKFQKIPRKGVYLATVLYKEDKVLCTVDDIIPVIPIDECAEAQAITQDYNWLMKVSCAWDDAKFLNYECADMPHASPSLRFRVKFLEAASQMQVALGVQDLGRLHCRPITDANGTTLLVTIQHVNDIKSVQGLAVKWMPLAKLLRKKTSSQSQNHLEKLNLAPAPQTAMDSLLASLVDYLNFFESTYIPLDKGLYLCYMKLHASMSDISIVVPENLPSVLPFVYMRHNPHVSSEEWDWLRILSANQGDETQPTSTQLAFHWSLVSAARILLDDLEISEDHLPLHRLYRVEVVEVHPDVSFILLVPPVADVCSAPNQTSMPLNDEKRGCLTLPVPVFEMAHLCTYQPEFIGLYCRLSAFVDFYVVILQQLLRQAFSENETQVCRQHRQTLIQFQQRLENAWKSVRWITDVASMARDKQMQSVCGLPLGVLFAYAAPSDPFEGGVDPATSDLLLAVPPSILAPSAAENMPARLDEGETVEDNSDVGYHSDQSAENRKANTAALDISPRVGEAKKGSATVDAQIASTSAAQQTFPSIDNPTYEYVETLSNTPVNRKSNSTRVYMNLVPNASSTPILSGTTELCHGNNYLKQQAHHSTKRIDSKTGPPPAYRTEINIEGEYMNYPSSSDSEPPRPARPPRRTGSNESQAPSHKSLKTVTTDSDSETLPPPSLHSRRSKVAQQTLDVHEDLSVIDHLYAVANHKQQLHSSRSFQSSPLPTSNCTPKRCAPAAICTDKPSPLPSGVLRVYAAYSCGLAKGTSVKLLVTPKTSAREMVQIVVQTLNKAVQFKGLTSPFYSDSELDEFCLVAVIGARERCLRDDFTPLELQNPWSKGRLFVRRRDDVLAALEYGNEAKV